MGYCPRCGENSPFADSPPNRTARRQPLRVSASSTIVKLPQATDGDAIYYGGMRFRIERSGDDLLLWAIE
jgi:hypothetical protein